MTYPSQPQQQQYSYGQPVAKPDSMRRMWWVLLACWAPWLFFSLLALVAAAISGAGAASWKYAVLVELGAAGGVSAIATIVFLVVAIYSAAFSKGGWWATFLATLLSTGFAGTLFFTLALGWGIEWVKTLVG